MIGSVRAAIAFAIFAFSASAAMAHTAYIVPVDFTPESATTIEGAYASQFFTPTIALSPSAMHVITPEGSQAQFAELSVTSPRTQGRLSLASTGTYRITSGEILGPVTQMVGVDGAWRALGQGEVAPEGAPLTTLQTVTLAEAYVTRGRPDETALAAPTGRLALRPVTHPNRIDVAGGFTVQLLFDGQPFANMPIVLYAQGDQDADTSKAFVTDANGQATIPLAQAGNYVIAVRHRASAVAGAAAETQSFTTTLTFEALTSLPELPPEERPAQRRRRY